MKRLLSLALLAIALPAFAPAQETRPTWTLGVGGSVATRYTYKTSTFLFSDPTFNRTYKETFGNTWMASLSVNRRLAHALSIQTGLDYFEQKNRGAMETARIGCLSAGVRLSSERGQQAHPYVEVLPAVYGAKWSDDLRDHSITSLRPGVIVGTGIVMGQSGRLKLDIGVKGHLSTDWPSLGAPYADSEYHGVKRMSFGGKLLYTL